MYEAAEDDEAYLTAIRVELVKDAPPETAEGQTRAVPGAEAIQADRVRADHFGQSSRCSGSAHSPPRNSEKERICRER